MKIAPALAHPVAWFLFALATSGAAAVAELHVAPHGDDGNPGTSEDPLRSIQHAASLAVPGDTVTVHAGTYRERINPPRGGESDARRIVYRAAEGETVEIKGSERVTGWIRTEGDTWKVELSNDMFGGFNPYADVIRGDWFHGKGREHHTGAVYLNGHWLAEAAELDELAGPVGGTPLWFATVDDDQTTIHAQFEDVDPNREQVEINVRRTIFYPDEPGRNYITVRGFTMRHAATPWAPPTAEQIGLIGTHWSKGWIIEDNVISHSICTGITLGKHGDEYDNTSADSAEGYVETIKRARAHDIPWTREHIGRHVVRDNVISHCEQAGIVGSLGGAFSTLSGNVIHDIHVREFFGGAEMAGIKLHGAIDARIESNHIFRTHRGLWLDWMAQGSRTTRNLFHDNTLQDVYTEVNHGPYLLDHNLFLSPMNIFDMSQGGSFAHNLFAGKIVCQAERARETPYHPAHSTAIAGITHIEGGDNRFFNNLFFGDGGDGAKQVEAAPRYAPRGEGFGLHPYDEIEAPVFTGGNVYYHGARPYRDETPAAMAPEFDPEMAFSENDGKFVLRFRPGPELADANTRPVTTEVLGEASVPGLPFVNPDGTPLRIEADFFGEPRESDAPTPGPFEQIGRAADGLLVWP